MRILVFTLLTFLFSSQSSFGQTVRPFYSSYAADSFDIYIDSGSIDRGRPVQYIYYLDAGIKSGKELRRQLSAAPDSLLANKIFVGIGHRGNFHQKRRRDFLPPGGSNGKGHADLFYQFLERELFPSLEAGTARAENRSLVGHSFGGLFAFYCLFREDRLFGRYFALSPSLWVGRYAILDTEKSFYAGSRTLPAFLYLSAGTRERLNHILSGARRMKALLGQRDYKGLQVVYEEHRGKTHNSQVPLSMKFIIHHLD